MSIHNSDRRTKILWKTNDRSYYLLKPLICQAVNKVFHVFYYNQCSRITIVTLTLETRKFRFQMAEWLPQVTRIEWLGLLNPNVGLQTHAITCTLCCLTSPQTLSECQSDRLCIHCALNWWNLELRIFGKTKTCAAAAGECGQDPVPSLGGARAHRLTDSIWAFLEKLQKQRGTGRLKGHQRMVNSEPLTYQLRVQCESWEGERETVHHWNGCFFRLTWDSIRTSATNLGYLWPKKIIWELSQS